MGLSTKILMTFFKVKIVSSIKGRIRVNIPNLRLYLNKANLEKSGMERLLKLVRGINSVEINLYTGSVLILYDPYVLNEKKIMNIVDHVIGSVASNMDKLQDSKISIEQLIKENIQFLDSK